mmetsp:Transcript_122365/g.243577  ORF Transcript_122365/g.243577 Transcript_122365/m.243577 type:complete len:104 (-) Transcript_122365:1279-1590(-)
MHVQGVRGVAGPTSVVTVQQQLMLQHGGGGSTAAAPSLGASSPGTKPDARSTVAAVAGATAPACRRLSGNCGHAALTLKRQNFVKSGVKMLRISIRSSRPTNS